MRAKRTLALWLLSAMFVVCSFFGVLSLNNKVVHAETTTPTWQQTLIANSNDGMIAFPTPIDNWKTSSSVISFDCDQPSVTITLLYSNMENYSHRATEKNVFSGTLVEASPSNYYHYEINASAFDVKGGGEYTGEETVYGFSNRGSEEFKIANLQVSGLTYEMPIKAVTISDLKENGKYVGDTLSLNGANTVYTYNSLLKSANNSVIFNFKFVANQWAVDGDGIQLGLMGKWATEGGLWLRPDKVRIIKDSGYVETITLAPNATYDIEYGRLAKMNGETFTGKFYFYVKINGELLGSYETTQESMLAKHDNATTADLAQPYIWIQRKSGLANNMLTDPTTYERPEKLLNVSDLKLNGSAVGEEISSNGSNTKYDYDASLQSANKSLVFQFKFTPADPWTTDGDGFQMNLMGAWANEGGIWIRPDTVYLLGGGVGGGNKSVASPLTTVGTTYLIEYGRLAMTVNGQFSGHYYFYLKIDGVLLLDYIGEKESVETKNNTTLGVAQIWIQRKNTINHTISNALVVDYETPADAVSVGDLSHGGSPVGDTLDFNDAPPYTYDSSFKTANHSLIFKFKFTTVNWVNNGDGGDGFQMGMFNAWPDATGGGLWIRPDAVRLMANGDYVVGGALANDTTYNVEWGRLAILENSVFTNKYYVYVKIDGELWIDCEVEGSAIGASNLEQTQLWIQRKEGYQSIMRDIDYAEITHETPANAVSIGDLSHGGSPVGDTLDFNDAPPYTYDSSFKTANHSLIFKFKFTTVNWVNNGDGGDGFQMGMFNAWPDATGGGLWIRPDAVRLMANGDYVVGGALANDTTYNVEWGRLAILENSVFTNKYYVYVKIDGELWIDCEVEGSAIGASNLEQTQLWIQRKAGYQSIMRDIDYAEAIYETPDEIGVSDLLYNGQSAEFYTMDSNKQFTIGKELTATNHSLVFRFMYNAITWTDNDNHGAQIRFLNSWDNTPGFVWIRPDKAYIFNASGSFVGSSNAISAGVHSVEVGRLAKVNSGTGAVINYLVYISIDGERVIEQEFESSELSAILGSNEIFITGSVGNEVYDLNYVPQQPIVKTYETPANAISVGDLKENGNLVGDELSLNNKNNATLTYDSNFKTANNSVIFKFKFVANQWSVDGDGIQIGLMGRWATEGGLWLRPDKVRIIKDSGYVESITLAPNATYDIEYGRLAILENGVYTGSFYFYVKVDGELIATYETTQNSMLEKHDNATTADLAQPNVWIQRKEGLANVIRDTDYISFTYETPDVVDVSDLLYNGLPFGGAYTIATTRFTIGKELTATNHSLSFRFVFNPKTWDEDGSPQIHFIDSYSETGFAWLKPNNTYIYKADGSYTNSGSTISNALHLVEVGRLAKVSDADGSVMGYKFFVKIDGETVVEYELASSEFASVSNLQDILNSKTIFITTDVGNQIYDVDYFPQMENAGDLYLVPWRLSASGIAFTASIESKIYNFRNITESGIIVVPTKNVTGNITLESTYENLLVIPASVSENAGLTLLKAGVLGILDGNICKDYTAVAYVKYAGADGGVVVAYSKPATTNLYEQISKAESVPAEVSAKLSKALAVNIDLATSAVAGASISGAIGDNTLTLTGSSASYSCYMINGQEVLAGETIVLGYSTYTVAINANKITLTKVATETVFGVSEHYTVLNDHYPEYLTPENIGSAMDELGLTSYRFDIALSDLFSVKEGDELVLRVDGYQKINALLSQMEEQGKTDSLAVLWYVQPYGHDYRWDGASNYVGSEKVIDFRSDWYTRYLDLNEEAVRQVALLFPQVVNFEVWNEPELGDQMVGWNGSTLTRLTPTQKAQFLTDIMYRVNRALKSVNSDITLTSPSLCTFQRVYDEVDCTTDEFLRCIYEAIADDIAPTGCEQDTKADNYFDVVNIHPYVGVGNTTDSNWGNWLETIHQISVENGDANTPIWITEFGFNTNGLTNNEINSKASILSSKISLIKNTDYITRVYFYTAIDDSTSEQKWGLFAWDNGLEIKATGEAVKEALK